MSLFEYGHYDDGEPFIKFKASGKELEANYNNSSLFTHGSDPHLDHFFVEVDESIAEEISVEMDRYRELGAFVWRQATEEFDDLVNFIIEENFNHIHKPYPHPEDAVAYARSGYEPPQEVLDAIIASEGAEVDDKIVREAMQNWDEEYKWYCGEEQP